MSTVFTTSTELHVAEAIALKRPASSLPPACLALLERPSSSVWSPDNLFLFISTPTAIQQYNPQLNTVSDVFSSAEPISHLVCRSQSSLVFAAGDKVHVLESGKLVSTFDSHKGREITSLALSGDLLASTTATEVHVHSLSLGSHTALRGLGGETVTTCAFHPHSRTKLLVGAGKQLLVYDTTRPSGPSKVIPMNDASTGHILSIAASPFSKTLIAVMLATSVALVDLDKEKGLFRTINLKVPLTAIAFSPEGASIYLGTEQGKLLILDLRALDKPPKAVVISGTGCAVETISVQTKVKTAAPVTKAPEVRRTSSTMAATTAPVKPVPKVAPSPAKARIARVGSGTSPARRPSALAAGSSNPKIFSPVRDPQGNTSIDEFSTKKAAPSVIKPRVESASARVSSRARSASSTCPVADSISAKSSKVSVSRPGSSASQRSSIPPVPPLPATARAAVAQSRTPSPDLPSVNGDPVTPLRVKSVLPLASPEVETKAKGKTVNFSDENEDFAERERERSLSMQISPRRPSSVGLGNSASWAPSPLRNVIPASPGGGSSSAHELLRGIVADVMFDFQQEQKAEMVGLHLDLVRLGRGLKQEVHKVMEEYVGDLKELRAENQRLREENDLLRRGY
ncbi:WD40-repeat-containing domain protein [Roridomyces roridus]|uniref:WD40-repeat-containing domain protein n=1 Tax=Roridomyces roridus TaxID=1738132 RepID=A0AAD7BWA4_9AGAR|nr:WD40-repeat-containing domain protein [Roridomyces roridus]